MNIIAEELYITKRKAQQRGLLERIFLRSLISGLWDYITTLHALVGNLQQHLQKSQDNVNEIRNILTPFARKPLFERKDGRKDAVLCVVEREERVDKRYSEMRDAAVKIEGLLQQNMQLFEMIDKQENPKWLNYIQFVDGIVLNYLFQTVGCSLGYINEHMDAANGLAPLFEAQLKLMEPDIVFIPSLNPADSENFQGLISQLLEDIMRIASIIPRLSKTTAVNYEEEIARNPDIIDIKRDILENVDKVVREAYEYSNGFHSYAYLWLEDKATYMNQFLTYSRQLTAEEITAIQLKEPEAPKPCPPKNEAFREQIDHFETLYTEVEGMNAEHIFNGWFKVDIKPFKHALLNTIRKWGNMFKEHLVKTVTHSLCDLGNFIRLADEGLQQTVAEGDYEALVKVMGFLLKVKERQAATDEMFGPLRETIELLKFYDQDIPEEINVYLQELPEQWNNTKKIAITIKQQVAPLQAAEVTCIRKRIAEFDVRITSYREVFKRYPFMRYDYPKPYVMMDRVNKDLQRFEKVMFGIHESGSLFEVGVPDFKLLKQCRKELRMLKVRE